MLEFRDISEPEIHAPDEIKIKVLYNTIGMSEMHMYQEGDYYSREGIVGTEMVGVITELGAQASNMGFSIGDWVAGQSNCFCGKCRFCLQHKESNCISVTRSGGTLCEYIVWKARQLVRLDDSISNRVGCLIQPVALSLESVRRMSIEIGDTVAILGASFTGLAILQLVLMRGAQRVTVVESNPYRQSLAKSLGAYAVINPADPDYVTQMLSITDFIGFDHVVETTGNPDILETALDFTARGGMLMLRTHYDMNRKTSFSSANIFFNNITITGAFMYNAQLPFAKTMLSALQLDDLIAEEFPFSHALDAFTAQRINRYPRTGINMQK